MKKIKHVHETICIVEWDDAASQDNWEATKEFRGSTGLVRCITVGFFLEETDKEIKLVRTCHEDSEYSEGMFAIPKGMIVSVIRLPRRKPKSASTKAATPPS
jgi:hypothetical protein